MTAYETWVAAGRPVTPAQPIREIVDQLRAAFLAGAGQFGWYADDAHYQADPPLDHTPYSVDGWPAPDPQWFVCATDIMVSAVGGLDVAQAIFNHLLESGRNGSAPWLKYLIWQGKNYDVRNGWNAATADDHYDHIHVSTRTDHLTTGLGGWTITGGDVSTADVIVGESQLWDQAAKRSTPTGRNFANAVYAVVSAGVADEFAALRAVIQQLADHITAGGGNVDTDAILAGVDTRLAALRDQLDANVRDALADEAEAGAKMLRPVTP